jgi:hypothetical protein
VPQPPWTGPHEPPTGPVEPTPGAHPGRLQHVALLWLREPGNEEHARAWAQAATALAAIDGVESLELGPAAPVSWAGPDTSFDFALTIVFSSRAAMERYQPHPLHQEAIALSSSIMDRVYAFFVELDALADHSLAPHPDPDHDRPMEADRP